MNNLILLLTFEGNTFMQFLIIISHPASIRDLNIALIGAIVTFILAGVVLVLEIITFHNAKERI